MMHESVAFVSRQIHNLAAISFANVAAPTCELQSTRLACLEYIRLRSYPRYLAIKSDATCKDGPRLSSSKCHRLGIACKNKNEEQERPKKKKGVIEISDDESDRKSDVRSEKRKKASPMADMVEMKRMEIVAHLGRLGMFEEYPYLSFNSFGESISSTLDDASSARSEADLVFLDVQMRFLRTIMMMMEKAEHIIEVKDKLRKVMKNMK